MREYQQKYNHLFFTEKSKDRCDMENSNFYLFVGFGKKQS
jgi:hypothetical protein